LFPLLSSPIVHFKSMMEIFTLRQHQKQKRLNYV
jgi:hypothetical protein